MQEKQRGTAVVGCQGCALLVGFQEEVYACANMTTLQSSPIGCALISTLVHPSS